MDRRDITELRGIGKKTGDLFRKLGVNTVEDLLHYYPRGYDAYEQPKEIGNLVPERTGAVLVRLPKTPDVVRYGRMPVATVTVSDERMDGGSVSLTLVWFNMPWMKKQLHAGQQYVFRGRVTRKRGRLTMEQPEVFTPEGYRAVADTMSAYLASAMSGDPSVPLRQFIFISVILLLVLFCVIQTVRAFSKKKG